MTRISRLILHAAAICAACLFTTSFASAKTEQKPAPWVPPQTTLPKEFVEAVAFMLENGLEDPRGLEFVEVQTHRPDPYNTLGSKQIGWLLPNGKEMINLLGLRRPVHSVVGKVDEAKIFYLRPGIIYSEPQKYALMSALLLVDGKTQLAEAGFSKEGEQKHWFIYLSSLFLGTKFHAAVNLHNNGDDEGAFRLAQELQKLWPLYEARAAKGLTEREIQILTGMSYLPPTAKPLFFRFLTTIEDIARDSSRRIKESRPILDPEKISNQDERIAVRIQNLENAKAMIRSGSGSASLASDSSIRSFMAEGAAAVEPLLRVLEKDDRLTRTSNNRSGGLQRYLLTVKHAAKEILQSIMGVNIQLASEEAELAALKNFWRKYKSLSPEERWMKEIEDESAGRQRWMNATRNLFVRTNSTREGQWVRTVPIAPGEPEPKFKAEVLRGKVNPSLSELLARRSRRMLAEENKGIFDYESSLILALYLTKWDPDAGLPVLQSATRATILESSRQGSQFNFDIVGPPLGQAIAARYDLGDKVAFEEWFEWIKSIEPIAGNDGGKSLYPLFALRSEPSVQKATDEIFAGKDSKWNLRKLAKADPYAIRHFAFSFFIGTQPVRDALIEILSDETEIATVSLDGSQMTIKFGNSSHGSSVSDEIRSKETHLPLIVGEQPVRVCDYVAYLLERLKGAPRVALYWPKEDRNAALAKLRDYFRHLPKDLNEVLPWPYEEEMRPYPN